MDGEKTESVKSAGYVKKIRNLPEKGQEKMCIRDSARGVHVRGGHAAGKSHGESHRFSGTGISAAIISPILQDDLEERLSQKSGMKEQVIREIDLDKRFKKKCWGNQVLPSPLTVLPAVCRR